MIGLPPPEVVSALSAFEVGHEKLMEIMERILHAFDRGLHGDPDVFHFSPIKMLPTFLNDTPCGSEVGSFYSVDLGGSNLRVFENHIMDGQLNPRAVHFEVPRSVQIGQPEPLFDYIAECIHKALTEFNVVDKLIPFFGFTFSFPINQLSLTSGTLIRWTKGYGIEGMEGRDVCTLLKDACAKLNLKISEFVLINDTTGTLLCGAYEDKDAVIGIINGTGTNACYIEDLNRVRKWKGSRGHKQIIINTEWGAFGEQHELDDVLTDIDRIIDANSLHHGQQVYEKMISGMYIGEIVRYCLIKLCNMKLIFNGNLPEALTQTDSIKATLLSDSYSRPSLLASVKASLGISLSEAEADIFAYVCDLLSRRGAGLTAAGLSAMLSRIDAPRCVIAGDGSMFRKHPKFVTYTEEAIRKLLPEKHFKIILVDDGSGKGATLAACVAASAERDRLGQ